MKRLVRWLSVLSLVLTSCFGLGMPAMAANLTGNFTVSALLSTPVLVAANVEKEDLRNKVSDKLTTSFGKKIDLNNTNLRAFRNLPGMYPGIAALVVKNAPYDRVDDVLNVAGLSEDQKETLRANFDNFTVTEQEEALTEGNDRINNGIYR
ncbi:MAG: photosystem II complex extrinsic protein PsbU [Alkalinema sp. RU_4_3]|nr:photosystem II complex extrinsic protein PsbU [Alkalinema sp. RU_4_3]